MSKLSFRARQLDACKAMPVYHSEEIPEVADVAAINRAVPQMPTGMEKEEETEHHLQRALSAQQVYGTSEALVIPVPEIDDVRKQYEQIYPAEYKPPKQYIHAQSLGADQEIPDYDIDSEDEAWLESQSKKMEITPDIFEQMIDRLEKGSGQQVVELKDAKVLLKEDDDLIITVYDYWLNKRLKYTPHSLIPSVKHEKRDGSTTNNPYVAFRRRTEKMQTRKNRKNDEVSYEKMLKLRRDLQRAVTVLEMIKKREKCKKELLQLTIEILDKRYDMEDFTGSSLAHAEAQKAPRPVFYPLYHDQYSKDSNDTATRKLKRKYEKKKHKSGGSQYHGGDVDVMDYGSTEEEPLSPGISVSDQEEEAHPDGQFAFRRKKLCNYHAPLESCGNWPWQSQQSGGHADKKYRYSLTSIDTGPERRRCIGYSRRRRGRGGRVILDRAYAEQRSDFWDRVFDATIPKGAVSSSQIQKRLDENKDLFPLTEAESSEEPTFRDYVAESKWLHFTPVDDYDSTNALFNGALLDLSCPSDDVNDMLDPIIDIIPDDVIPSSLPHGLTPIVTSHCASALDTTSAPLCPPQQTLTQPNATCLATSNTNQVYDSKDNLTIGSSSTLTNDTDTSSTTTVNIEHEYESHQRHLQALKKDLHDQLTYSNNKLALDNSTTKIIAQTHNSSNNSVGVDSSNHLVDSKKATFAITALVNGQTGGRGNGIKHINGPTNRVEAGHVELKASSHSASNNLRKLNFPLTPSSDTSETTGSSMTSDLLHVTSIPGERGDNSSQIHNSDKEYTDSAGLNSIPDVASTMEVS